MWCMSAVIGTISNKKERVKYKRRIILEKLGKIQEIVVQKGQFLKLRPIKFSISFTGYPPKRTLSRELLYTENFVVENEKYKLELIHFHILINI